MKEFVFAKALYLLLLVLVPFLVIWHLYLKKQGKRFIYFSSQTLIRSTDGTAKAFFIRNLPYIKMIALTLMILALARPQFLNYFNKESNKGIDILLTLDISGSMGSVDFKPKNRLEVAKDVISNFIEKRKNDRLGLVVFAGISYTQCPITIDHDMLKDALKETTFKDIDADGTAIGMALATSVNHIKQSESKTRIIILLTDGMNNRGEIDPRDAADIAKTFNAKVYTIGVGTRGKAPYPYVDANGRKQFIMAEVKIDEELLKEIANKTGGLYFRATDKEQLQQIFSEIDRWEKTEISTKRYHTSRDLYHYFLIAGLILLLLAEFGKRTILRTLP
jgi:Ca-activated chloride channel homolog